MASEPTADCTYEDLIRIYRENCGLANADECSRALRALRQLRLIQPEEIEGFTGDRMKMRDIEKAIGEAEKSSVIFGLGTCKTTVICPTDCLR